MPGSKQRRKARNEGGTGVRCANGKVRRGDRRRHCLRIAATGSAQLLEANDARRIVLNHARPGRGRRLPNWGAMGRAPFAETFHGDLSPGTILRDRARTLRSRCAIVPDPAVLDWHLAPWPSFALVEETGRDRFAEAALGSSSHLTGTPDSSGEPANPKTGDDPGRRRIFWWRDNGDMPLSQSSGRKASLDRPRKCVWRRSRGR